MNTRKTDRWKIKQSLKIISLGLRKYQHRVAVAWAGGLDSMALLHLTRSVSKDVGHLPVLFLDSGFESKQTYDLLRTLKKEWQLSVIRVTDKATLRQYRKTRSKSKRKELLAKMKIRALKKAVREYRLRAIFVGVRWEEQEAYESEVYVSPRKKHVRVHPLLHFSRKDIANYMKEFHVPHRPMDDWELQTPSKPSFIRRIVRTETLTEPKKKEKLKVTQRLRETGYF